MQHTDLLSTGLLIQGSNITRLLLACTGTWHMALPLTTCLKS